MVVTVFIPMCRLETPQAILGIVETPSSLTTDAVPIKLLAVRSHPNIVGLGVVGETSVGKGAASFVGFVTDVRNNHDRYGTKGADDTYDRVLANIGPARRRRRTAATSSRGRTRDRVQLQTRINTLRQRQSNRAGLRRVETGFLVRDKAGKRGNFVARHVTLPDRSKLGYIRWPGI